jgi:hypothetical protein
MEKIINKSTYLVKKNKKKLIFLSIAGLIGFYLYKKYLSEKVSFLRELYKKISEETQLMNTPENLNIKYENSFNNLITRLIDELKLRLDKEFNLAKVFEMITSAQGDKNEMARQWIEFKDRNLIYLHSVMFITRSIILISQTQLLVIDKLNSKFNLPKQFLDDLLTELWFIALDYIDHLIKCIYNRLKPLVEEIVINHNYNRDSFLREIIRFRERIEDITVDRVNNEIHYVLLESYFKILENKIVTLENNSYTNSTHDVKIYTFLKFYQINYDVLTSNLFQSILLKSLDLDFTILFDTISLNFENITSPAVSVAKIINFINKTNNYLLDKENTIFFFKNYKESEFYEELKEYFRVIYE